MMLLQIEHACSNLYGGLYVRLLELEHACSILQEYLYSLNIRKIYKRAVTKIVLPHFCYSLFAVFHSHICCLK